MKSLICVPCDQCGKDVWKKKWDIEHYKNHFCSKECFSNFRKVGQTIQCCNCGKEIYRNEMEIAKSKSGRFFVLGNVLLSLTMLSIKLGKVTETGRVDGDRLSFEQQE
jgi:hypothetical protein